MNVFLDTNVLMDVLARRDPFCDQARRVWILAEARQVAGFISALSVPNLYYILRRAGGDKPARLTLLHLPDVFSLVPLDAQIVSQAVDSDIPDFEDAIQFFSALRVGADVLVTRNSKDFPKTDVVIQTPAEFLMTHFPSP